MEEYLEWFGLNKRVYMLKISSLFHFRQKKKKNQKNNKSFIEKLLFKSFKNMEVMKCVNGLNKIVWMKITSYVHLKDPKLLDLSIFDRMSNDDFCLPCMLTNQNSASIVYAIEGFIPLHDFLSQYVFENEEGYIFLHQLFEQAIASNRNKPVLFDPDYVFVSPFGDRFAFIVVPIQITNWMFQRDMSEKWVEYIAKTMQTTTAFEIPGFLLKFLKSTEFSLPNLVLGLDNIRELYYPKKFSFFKHRRIQTFKVKEPIQAFHKNKPVESILEEKTQLLQVQINFSAYLMKGKEKYSLANEMNLIGRAMSCDVRFFSRFECIFETCKNYL